jgi:hypothetical protein
MEPVPTASSKLSVEDAIRLRRLGLLTWNWKIKSESFVF